MEFAVSKRRSARQLAGRKTVYYEGDTDDEGVELLSDYDDDGATRLENAPAASASQRLDVSSRRSKRQLAGRKRSVYYEGDSDKDVQLLSYNSDEDAPGLDTVRTAPARTQLPSPKRRSARQPVGGKKSMYYEGDSDDDTVLSQNDHHSDRVSEVNTEPPPVPPPQRPRKRIKITHNSTARSKKQKSTTSARPKKRWEKGWSRPLGTFPKKKSTKKPVESSIPSDGVKPAWGSLPVEILRDIFIFASQPIHETINGSAGVTWLMKTARKTSPDFAVPALEAYYLSPALHTTTQPHHLLELLQLPPDDTYIKYRYKVKRLEIDVKHLAYSAQGRGPFDLSALVRAMPQLQQLEVTHPMDEPPYRPLKFQKWHYPPDLFDAMDDTGIRLRTWRWSRDMLQYNAPEDMYGMMANIHGQRCFEYLDRLVICGFDFNDSAEPAPIQLSTSDEAGANKVLPTLTAAISCLPKLKDLTFISCDIVMEDFLFRLPKALERLELTNCLEVTADMLQTYLATHGSQLRELVLNSNAALNLAFLPCLKTACPKLETLIMDTTYYSEKTNYNDAYAFYEQLLMPSERPTWPSTLRHLELTSLQKWGADAASTLFRSLIEAAPELPDLRQLTIQAHIDIAWRDRADFRDTWVDKLRATFFHKTPPPLPYLCSLKRYRAWKEEQPLPIKESLESGDDADSTMRSLSHVRITPRKPADDHIAFSESEAEPDKAPRHGNHPRRSARVAESQSAASLSATPGPETPGSGEAEAEPRFVQGLCEVVDIRIDNQRPRETQYTEANFIDSEVSGDEDWHEGAAELSDDGYAW